jgi:hypothetical protein
MLAAKNFAMNLLVEDKTMKGQARYVYRKLRTARAGRSLRIKV